jgi:hypothetical protein
MKTRNLMLILFLGTVVLFGSCKKDSDDNPGAGNGTFSLTVDGATWSASLSVQAVNSNGIINVTGSDSQAKQAAVVLYGVTAPGTYQIGLASPSNMLRWTEGINPADTYTANGAIGSGTITVTELTASKIKGTFSFTGFNTSQSSKTITNGQFEANF